MSDIFNSLKDLDFNENQLIEEGILSDRIGGGTWADGMPAEIRYSCGRAHRGKVAWNKGRTQPHKKHKPRSDKGTPRPHVQGRTRDDMDPTGFQQKKECPHCNKQFDKGNFARYHGSKCKFR